MEPQELKNQISRVVDSWVTEIMRSKLLEKPGNMERRSLWDKFKQGMTNWLWGRNGEKHNPYRWRNRFGDELGVTESFNPSVFTLNEYMGIKGVIESVEDRLDESDGDFDKLRIMQLVRSAAETLKDMLFNALNGKVSAAPPAAGGSESRGEEPSSVAGGAVAARQASNKPRTGVVEDPRNRRQAVPPVAKADGSAVPPVAKADGSATQPVPPPKTNGAGAVAGNKTDRQKIEDAAVEAARLRTSDVLKLTPNKDWLKNGKLLKERIPHVLVWMSMKGHRESLSDEHIRQELKDALGGDVDLGTPASSGRNLERYLKRTLAERFETVMRSLGVDFKKSDAVGEQKDKVAKDKDKKKEKLGDQEVDQEESGDQEVDQGESGDQEVDGEEPSFFRDYLYDGDRALEPREAFTRLHGLVDRLIGGIESENAKKLKAWYEEERKKLRTIPRDDRAEYLQANMSGTDTYLEKIMEITGLNKEEIAQKLSA